MEELRRDLAEEGSYALRPSSDTRTEPGQGQGSPHAGGESVRPRAGLERELVWASSVIEDLRPLFGQSSGDKAAKNVARGYASHPSVRLAQHGEARHGQAKPATTSAVPAPPSPAKAISSAQPSCRISQPRHPGELREVCWRLLRLRAERSTLVGTEAAQRAGSVSASHVASVPGASSAAVSTCRARESSPCRTLAHARRRLRSDARELVVRAVRRREAVAIRLVGTPQPARGA